MAKEDFLKWAEQEFSLEKVFEKPEALSDIIVVEFCTLILGPATPSYLAEFGATIIKLELPGMGDTMRSLTPWGRFFKNQALGYLKEARNKFSVGLDLHYPEGKEIFIELIKKADVFVENLRAGTLDRWGIGYRQMKEVNPGIIYIANNGFGQWGPYVERPSYDAIAQSESGEAWISGFPGRLPMKSGIWLCDYYGALMAAVGILAALHYRERTGKGQYIEFSQAENIMRAMDWTWLYQFLTQKPRERYGNRDVAICPCDIFISRDKEYVAIGCATDEQFRGLCMAMGRPELADDPRFATNLERTKPENAEELLKIVKEWVANNVWPDIDKLAQKYGFGAEKVHCAKDFYSDSHFEIRGFKWKVKDPIYGEFYEEGIAPKLSETPGRIKWAGRPVGFDTYYVLTKFLGKTWDEIQKLEKKGVIGKWNDMPGRKPPEDWDGKSGIIYP